MNNIFKWSIILYIITFYFCLNLEAQTPSLFFKDGNAVVTHFSGENLLPNPNGYVLKIIETKNATFQKKGENWSAPAFDKPSWRASTLGEIFGICIDSSKNIYVTSTSIYGKAPLGIGGPGAVYKIDAITGEPSVFVKLPNRIDDNWKHYPNLGNICFDIKLNRFYVSNFEDGKIYCLNFNGSINSIFDPFKLDDNQPGFAPLGERIWGLGVNNGRLYYGRYISDRVRFDSLNQIWSVQINSQGFVLNSNFLELILPSDGYAFDGNLNKIFFNSPPSDIEFSFDGKYMLVAGRTMSNDMIDNQSSKDPVTQINPFAHFSNLREFNSLSGLSNSWNSINSKIIPIGYKSELERSNCSGGCDYSFFPIDNGNFNVRDSFVWSTGDALHFTPLPDLIYGLQGTPRNDYENAFVNSVLIDVDNDLVSYDKAMIGDVDIFKPNPNNDCIYLSKYSINFNTQYCFGNDSQKLEIYNCGSDTLKINLYIKSGLFFSLGPDTNFTININETKYINVNFNPNAINIYNDTLVMVTNSKTNPIINIPLNGKLFEKKLNLISSKSIYNFGICDIGKFIIDSVKLYNKNDYPIKLIYQKTNQNFIFSEGIDTINIKKFDSQFVKIKFIPTSCYQDSSKIFIYNVNCPDTLTITAFGEGNSLNSVFTIGTNSKIIHGDYYNNLLIPIILTSDNITNDEVKKIETTVKFKSNLLYPEQLISKDTQRIKVVELNRFIDGDYMNIRFELNIKYLNFQLDSTGKLIVNNDTLAFLELTPFQSDDSTSEIIFESVNSFPCQVLKQTRNGFLKVIIRDCNLKDRQIELFEIPEIESIQPNPTNDKVLLKLSYNKLENSYLRLYNVNGKLVKKITFNKNSNSNIVEYELCLQDESNGIYTLIFASNSGSSVKNIIVNK
ncbi:MAG: T9SS type A sorting domain-containing protein [Chlorobi bacterium]|nr:T9SS type A sorting domain-containing protein [Chlorobiota bacterium]